MTIEKEDLPKDNLFELNKIDKKLFEFIKNLKYKNIKLNLKGSASLKHIKFPPDFDFYTYLDLRDKPDVIYKHIKNIIDKSSANKHMYFINISVGSYRNHDDRKIWDNISDFTKDSFLDYWKNGKDIEYIQLEFIIKFGNKFVPLTSDYYFYKPKSTKIILRELKDGIEKNMNDKNYMKVLKRIFNQVSILDPTNIKSYELLNFFNSNVGQKYQDLCILKAIQTLVQKYNDKLTVKKAVSVINKIIKSNTFNDEINDFIEKYDAFVNSQSKLFLDYIQTL